MPDLILHHYDCSPFAEKMRLVLGLKGLPWCSAIAPSVMPKPDLVALTGGYRHLHEHPLALGIGADRLTPFDEEQLEQFDLGAHGDVLADRHRAGVSDETGKPCQLDHRRRRIGPHHA